MADKKISQLTAASTPLAGTEVLPIVQGGATVNVSVANLTSGRSAEFGAGTVAAPSITTTGDTDTGLWFPAANITAISTGGTEKLRVDSAGNLLVGTTTTTNNDGIAGLTVVNASTPGVIIGNTGGGRYYALWSDTSGTLNIRDNNADANRMTINSSGNVTVSTGNVIVGTAGKGIDFSANTNAAGMTSELLTWYEEGTWTPAYVSTGATFTHTTQVGWYRRIGSMIYAGFDVTASAAGTTTNSLTIGGLPFASTSAANNLGALTTGATSFTEAVNGYVAPSDTVIGLLRFNLLSSATPNSTGMTGGDKRLSGIVMYRA